MKKIRNQMGDADHYDLDVLRAIPLTEICAKLNIELGRNNRACCPFHSEQTPSFHINPKNFYKCFGCGAGGDSIKFVEEFMKVDFKEAIRWLADMKNVQPGQMPGGLKMNKKWRRLAPIKQPVITTLTPTERMQRQKMVFEMGEVLRGVSSGDSEYGMFADHMERRGWEMLVLQRLNHTGMLGSSLMGSGISFLYPYATKVRHDIASSRSCRWVHGGAAYSVWNLVNLDPNSDTVVIYEGETDMIAGLSARPDMFGGSIAAPGASWVPDSTAANAIGFGRKVLLACDNDTAGRQAMTNLRDAFAPVGGCGVYGFDWKKLPTCSDIGDVLQNFGASSLIKALDNNWIKI